MTHRVSWLDQPSLVDTITATARIAGHIPRRPGLRSSAGFAAAANFLLLRLDSLLKNFGYQPQVLSTVRMVPFKGPHVLGPESKCLQNRVRAI